MELAIEIVKMLAAVAGMAAAVAEAVRAYSARRDDGKGEGRSGTSDPR